MHINLLDFNNISSYSCIYILIHDFIFLPWLYISYEHQNCYSYEFCKSPQNTKHIQEVINIPNRIDSIQKQGRHLKTASSFSWIYLLIVMFSSFVFHRNRTSICISDKTETHQRLKYFFYEDYISIRSRYFQIWNHLYFIELLKRWYELKCSMLLKGKRGRGVRYYQKIFNSSLDNLIHKYNAFVSFDSF